MLKHGKEKANPERFKFLYSGAKRIAKVGIFIYVFSFFLYLLESWRNWVSLLD